MKKSDFKKVIIRPCLVCGKKQRIVQYKDGHCKGAYYFGIIKDPIEGTGEQVKTGTFKLGRKTGNVVKWTGKTKDYEYWECKNCYQEGCFESTLEDKLHKLYGKRCKDFEAECIVCQVWAMYDTIIKDNRGEL